MYRFFFKKNEPESKGSHSSHKSNLKSSFKQDDDDRLENLNKTISENEKFIKKMGSKSGSKF